MQMCPNSAGTRDSVAYPSITTSPLSMSTDFILPGRRKDHVPLSKASLAKAFAVSRASNPRNIEYPWYGYWCQTLVDLISEHERLLNIPQHLLYYTISDESEAENKAVDVTGDTSISSIPSVAATTSQPLGNEIIPDFAIIHVIFRWRDPDGPKRWRNVKIRHAGVPLLVEIKRAGGRSAKSLAETLVHMASTERGYVTGSLFVSHDSCSTICHSDGMHWSLVVLQDCDQR